VKLYIQYSM